MERKTAEVEFLREKHGQVLPVEVKSGWVTQAKSLKVFSDKYNPPYRTVMSAKNLNIDHKNRIHHYPLYLAARFSPNLIWSLFAIILMGYYGTLRNIMEI